MKKQELGKKRYSDPKGYARDKNPHTTVKLNLTPQQLFCLGGEAAECMSGTCLMY